MCKENIFFGEKKHSKLAFIVIDWLRRSLKLNIDQKIHWTFIVVEEVEPRIAFEKI
jgi:hypothetical protein